ncbi:ABC transporter substrate-binding protein [Amaricoccus solimangrovi]|uniref:ABC transporter substrate-binding protein n=1 Tax=Amaricoccus solimangrovi TaxID=2589815 RepID=A0A501WA55_9RHOB|nr:ABC transporter substrate-binding protein [Amaricoccus solimangrovi]TPE46509.1 ABC transporter substrate-binding protein [Amaricoccus solimangrovi]
MNNGLNRRNFNGLLLGASAAAVGGIALPGRARAAGDDVSIATTAGLTVVTMTQLMMDQGFLGEFDLVPSFIPVKDGSKVIASLYSGESDICVYSGFPQILPAIEKGADLKIVAMAGKGSMSVLYSGRDDIRTLADLKGKTIGAGSTGSNVNMYMTALLRTVGLDEKDVIFVNIGGNTEIFRAVTAGVVDAGVGEVMFMYEPDKWKVHAVAEVLKALPEYTGQASYTSGNIIGSRRDVLVRTLAAYRRLYRFMQQGDSEQAWIDARKTATSGKESPEIASLQWKYIRDNNVFGEGLPMDQARVDWMQDLNISLGIQKGVMPFDQIVDPSLAADAEALERKTRA